MSKKSEWMQWEQIHWNFSLLSLEIDAVTLLSLFSICIASSSSDPVFSFSLVFIFSLFSLVPYNHAYVATNCHWLLVSMLLSKRPQEFLITSLYIISAWIMWLFGDHLISRFLTCLLLTYLLIISATLFLCSKSCSFYMKSAKRCLALYFYKFTLVET